MKRFIFLMTAAVFLLVAPGARASGMGRHVIYLHGRIIQAQQNPRPTHPQWGTYELEKILDAFRARGFIVTGDIREESATVSSAADVVVRRVRDLMARGVPPDHITVVGGSMGAGIALVAAARLEHPDVRFAVLGTCLTKNVPAIAADEGRAPSGRVLAIRESSDELTQGCVPWGDESNVSETLHAREIVVETGLSHGFLYRPIPEWLDPVLELASSSEVR